MGVIPDHLFERDFPYNKIHPFLGYPGIPIFRKPPISTNCGASPNAWSSKALLLCWQPQQFFLGESLHREPHGCLGRSLAKLH